MYTTLSKEGPARTSPARVLSLGGIRIMVNASLYWTLGIMGGAILPVPGAFAQTGAVCSTLFMVLTAAANVYTSDLLFWQAFATKRHDYESLSIATGGRILKHVSIASLLVLLLGTLLSTIQQAGEVMAAGINYINPNYTGIMVQGNGRIIMLLAMIVIAPLSLLHELRKLEIAGDFGILVVIVLVLVTMINSISHGLPALGNDFPDVGFSSIGNVASSVATYGFIFYLQPISMAMLPEFPQTRASFGAARFGADAVDAGNILQNNLGQGNKQGTLNIFFAVYVILAIAPFEFATRHSLDHWVRRFTGDRWRLPRNLCQTCLHDQLHHPCGQPLLLFFGKAMVQKHPERVGGPSLPPASNCYSDSAHGVGAT
ncbi:hypothetical protein WJX84_001539 [Apatococcus fuscideae]|uniref:Amino acid transporter transmembrane domain-containing protein n=1 Tax=Apatococcus fuscideae TaxID=2026836 RepID=A0AAW1SY47_9CHLO